MQDLDCCIIGAGAAGIAAARHLIAHGRSVLVLEASDRIGGRAFTHVAGGYPLDIGCGWFHSADRNSWARHAREVGAEIDKTLPPWMKPQNELGFSAEEQAAFGKAREDFEAAVDKGRHGLDRPAADFLIPGCRWNPLLDALSSYINGAELDRLSVHDYLAFEDADTGVNWRLPAGYGSLVASAAVGVNIRSETPATRVEYGGARLKVETPRGTIVARSVLVTVSTAAFEQLAFDPPLPGKQEAAAKLPLGLADKVTFSVSEAQELPSDTGLFGRTDTSATANHHLRPFGRPLIESYLGGRHAEALEAEGQGATAAFCADELVAQFGSDFRKRLTPLAASAWRRTPHILGSYSHACPGHRAARATLAEPVENRLFFAGEATSPDDFSTAHGAHDSGIRAADEALAALTSSD